MKKAPFSVLKRYQLCLLDNVPFITLEIAIFLMISLFQVPSSSKQDFLHTYTCLVRSTYLKLFKSNQEIESISIPAQFWLFERYYTSKSIVESEGF